MTQMIVHDLASRTAEDVADKENFHTDRIFDTTISGGFFGREAKTKVKDLGTTEPRSHGENQAEIYPVPRPPFSDGRESFKWRDIAPDETEDPKNLKTPHLACGFVRDSVAPRSIGIWLLLNAPVPPASD